MDIQLYSYLYGLFGTDGNVRRTQDNESIYDLTLELIDEDIIQKIAKILPDCTISERVRDTNFKQNHHSFILHCHNKDFINWCENNNFPISDKTNLIAPPSQEYDKNAFWRGIIDGDGSIGIKKADGQPFINLTTKSESLKNSYCLYIQKLTGFLPKSNRNQRDKIFNITLHGEKAIKIMNSIYSDSNIYIDRKYNEYLKNKDWKKKSMKGVVRQKWTPSEVEDLLILSDEEFHQKYPNRTLIAIRNKRKRL